MSISSLYMQCTFSLGNFNYLFRCRKRDQFCCGHTCCFKENPDPTNVLESWYFWSLVLVLLVVFGCVLLSFTLSSLKARHEIESWSAMANSAFANLATTVINKQGIIQPRVFYNTKNNDNNNNNNNNNNSVENLSTVFSIHSQGISAASSSSSLPSVVDTSNKSGEMASKRDVAKEANRVGGSRRESETARLSRWTEVQLSPLQPPYESNYSNNLADSRIAASTQVFFPPGFIQS